MAFLFVVPIIFIIVLVQFFHIFKGNKSYVERGVFQGVFYIFGLLGLISTLFITSYVLFIVISSSSYFCHHTGCQAAGYVYLFATPITVCMFVISEIFLATGAGTEVETP